MDIIPSDLATYGKDAKALLKELQSQNERMFLLTFLVMNTGETEQELETNVFQASSIAQKYNCNLRRLDFQQEQGLMSCLPLAMNLVQIKRALTTTSTAIFVPFTTQELFMGGESIYYGLNALSNNLIMADRKKLKNPNGLIVGTPGAGKSFAAKREITNVFIVTKDDIIICDPEAEYSLLVKELGGEVITIAAGSENHVNAMDMLEGYGDSGNPVGDKSQFIMSLFEQLDRDGIKPVDRSIIDRCVTLVFQDYYRTRKMPTLVTLREKLLEQPEMEARSLALKLELFTDGSLDAFAHQTNVNTSSRIVSYDIFKLGKQLKTMGLLVITDAMINRVNENWRKGKRTHIILDEFHVVFENEESASFFNSAWRQFRKRDGYPIGITQNVEYLLDSVQASTMLSNSEFVVMLNQSYQDREKLAKLLNISDEQLSYITNAQSGCGLIKYGGNIVPFINRFPKNTLLYKLMSTKPSEKNK